MSSKVELVRVQDKDNEQVSYVYVKDANGMATNKVAEIFTNSSDTMVCKIHHSTNPMTLTIENQTSADEGMKYLQRTLVAFNLVDGLEQES